jgi:hypothetical protein
MQLKGVEARQLHVAPLASASHISGRSIAAGDLV